MGKTYKKYRWNVAQQPINETTTIKDWKFEFEHDCGSWKLGNKIMVRQTWANLEEKKHILQESIRKRPKNIYPSESHSKLVIIRKWNFKKHIQCDNIEYFHQIIIHRHSADIQSTKIIVSVKPLIWTGYII